MTLSSSRHFLDLCALSLLAPLLAVACQSKPTEAAATPIAQEALTESEIPAGQRAKFFAPTGVVAYSDISSLPLERATKQDYLLVADTKNHAVRRVELATGFVSTVAGTLGVPGSGETSLHGPTAVAIAPSSNVFVADTGNQVIRHFRTATLGNTNGQPLHTIAGVPTQAGYATTGTGQFKDPAGICIGELSTDGNEVATLFVADTGNAVIRKLTVNATREPLAVTSIELVAGTPGQHAFADASSGSLAKFNHPNGLAYDRISKKLYVADTGNHVVRVIDLANGASIVSTLAGAPGQYGHHDAVDAHDARFAQPVGLTIKGPSQILQVADRGSYTIREIDISPNAGLRQVSTFAGEEWKKGSADGIPAAPRFRAPSGVASLDGVTYVVDTGNNLVRAIKTTGVGVSTLTGQRSPGAADGLPESFSIGNPSAIACDGNRLYINGNGVQAVDLEPGANVGHARLLTSESWTDLKRVGTRLFRPLVYNVEQLDTVGGETSIFTSVANVDSINQVVACPNSLIDFQSSEPSGDSTQRFPFVDGQAMPSELLPAYRFDLAACSETGRVYSCLADGELSTFDSTVPTPVVTTVSVPGLKKYEFQDFTIAGGFAYYTRRSGTGRYHDVRKIDLATGAISVVAGDATTPGSPFTAPGGVCVSGNNLFVADTGNGAVRRVDLTTAQVSTVTITRAE